MDAGRPIRFGIIGCGSIGPTHAAAIGQIEGASLVAVADVIADRARAMGDKFNVSAVYASSDDLLANPNVDAVCICTPSGMHADGAIAAMRAGKHAIVEKPMDVSLAACDRMISTANETGKTLAVISQHRFDSASLLVKELLDSGRLGKLLLVTAEVKWWRTQAYYDSGDWRGTWALDGGGALMNQGVHTVDLLRWFAGPPASIMAHIRTAAHERMETEDIAVAALTFKNGAIGTLVATTAAFEGLPARIDLFGTLGSAIIEGDRLKQVILKDGTKMGDESAADHATKVAQGGTASVRDAAAGRTAAADPGAVWGDAHRSQLEDFIHAIRAGESPRVDGRAGREAVELVVGVYDSARTGKIVTL